MTTDEVGRDLSRVYDVIPYSTSYKIQQYTRVFGLRAARPRALLCLWLVLGIASSRGCGSDPYSCIAYSFSMPFSVFHHAHFGQRHALRCSAFMRFFVGVPFGSPAAGALACLIE